MSGSKARAAAAAGPEKKPPPGSGGALSRLRGRRGSADAAPRPPWTESDLLALETVRPEHVLGLCRVTESECGPGSGPWGRQRSAGLRLDPPSRADAARAAPFIPPWPRPGARGWTGEGAVGPVGLERPGPALPPAALSLEAAEERAPAAAAAPCGSARSFVTTSRKVWGCWGGVCFFSVFLWAADRCCSVPIPSLSCSATWHLVCLCFF